MQLFKGDSQYILGDIKDATIDMVVTSPPYDLLRNTYGTNVQFTFEKFTRIAEQLVRVLVPGGTVVWVVGDECRKGSESGTSFKQALYFKSLNMNLHDTMIYEKNSSSFPARRDGNRCTQIFEYMFVFTKGSPKNVSLLCSKVNKWAGWQPWGEKSIRDQDGNLIKAEKGKPTPLFGPRTNIWKYSTGAGFSSKDKLASKHPAIYPLELAIDNILQWSTVDDTVLDPFLGSGTSAIASVLTNRNFIGIELNDAYFDLAKERIALYETEPKITKDLWEARCIEQTKRSEVIEAVKLAATLGLTKEEILKYVDEGFSYSRRNNVIGSEESEG